MHKLLSFKDALNYARHVLPVPKDEAEEEFLYEQFQTVLKRHSPVLWEKCADGSEENEEDLDDVIQQILDNPSEKMRFYLCAAMDQPKAAEILKRYNPLLTKDHVGELRQVALENKIAPPIQLNAFTEEKKELLFSVFPEAYKLENTPKIKSVNRLI